MTDLRPPPRPLPGAPARVRAPAGDPVTAAPLADAPGNPFLVRPLGDGVDLRQWLAENGERVEGWLRERGGVLFRGFDLGSPEDLSAALGALGYGLLDYVNRSTPRTRVDGKVFTTTEYPADQRIPQHNEMSYADRWPRRIAFLAVTPAETGGETPLADSRAVYEAVPPAVRERFARDGVMYVRNMGLGLDLHWEEVFQTSDRAQVEQFCAAHGIECRWMGDEWLQTRQVRPAWMVHGETGAPVWFNQAHLFHPSSLGAAAEAALRGSLGERIPRDVLFGDGSPIGAEQLDAVRAAYDACTVAFAWERGDLLLLDNELISHGRAAFTGPRRVLAAMGDPGGTAETLETIPA
jgi:hypothetical protein